MTSIDDQCLLLTLMDFEYASAEELELSSNFLPSHFVGFWEAVGLRCSSFSWGLHQMMKHVLSKRPMSHVHPCLPSFIVFSMTCSRDFYAATCVFACKVRFEASEVTIWLRMSMKQFQKISKDYRLDKGEKMDFDQLLEREQIDWEGKGSAKLERHGIIE